MLSFLHAWNNPLWQSLIDESLLDLPASNEFRDTLRKRNEYRLEILINTIGRIVAFHDFKFTLKLSPIIGGEQK